MLQSSTAQNAEIAEEIGLGVALAAGEMLEVEIGRIHATSNPLCDNSLRSPPSRVAPDPDKPILCPAAKPARDPR